MASMIPNLPLLSKFKEDNFFLIAGPCVIEDEENPFHIAEVLKAITQKLQIPFIFKASYRKANRSSIASFTGIGDEKALHILHEIREQFKIPVLTDIHTEAEAALAAPYVDVLQIPAFLCRQTELLLAAAETGKWINIKKGQFLSGEAMQFAIEKISHGNNQQIMVTERGNFYGYGDLVVDFRNIPVMQQFNVPVILDITHSLQKPNQSSGITGGQPQMIETIAKAGIAAGANGIFLETHPHPEKAKSDGANMLKTTMVENLLMKLVSIYSALQ